MVVAVKFGVVKLAPVNNAVPPVALANQLIVPELAVANKVTVPFPHRDAGVVAVIVAFGLIVAITAVRVVEQVPFAAST